MFKNRPQILNMFVLKNGSPKYTPNTNKVII